jgi:hypothetical protein
VCAASCGDEREPYAFAQGSQVHLTITVREELETAGSRQVELTLLGTAFPGGDVNFRVRNLRHERVLADGSRTLRFVDTSATATDPSELTPGDVSVARILNSGVGRVVAARFDPREGLASLSGVAPLLRPPAVEPRDEETAAGLLPLLEDEVLVRALRAAGLCAVQPQVEERAGTLERPVSVEVPGLGTVPSLLFGPVGREHEGSPVAKLKGRVREEDVPAMRIARQTAPDEVGPVVLQDVEVSSETLHDPVSLRPLRGTVEVVVPYARGAVLRRRTSFRLVETGP